MDEALQAPLYETSAFIGDLAAALAKAQSQVTHAVKDELNPHFRSRYADLAGVWDACREALSSNGLSVVQMPTSADGRSVTVVTQIMHPSGQWMRSALTLLPTKADPQGIGSATTYARRYALAAMVGVAQDDDDGNAASQAPRRGEEKPPAQTSKPAALVTTEQASELVALLDQTQSDYTKFIKYFHVEDLSSLKAKDFERARRLLAKKIGNAA